MDEQDFLVELGTEELPPLSLRQLSDAFSQNVLEQLDAKHLSYGGHHAYATPRRLSLHIKNLIKSQPNQPQERLGPVLSSAFNDDGTPTPAARGFAKSCGVDIKALKTKETSKGVRLFHQYTKVGEPIENLLPDIISHSLSTLPIPKRMRWGAEAYEFIRPVHWLIMLIGKKIIPCQILGLQASNQTRGHRFHTSKPISVSSPQQYKQALIKEGFVMPDFLERRAYISQLLLEKTQPLNAQAFVNEKLLDEVTALVEWPVALVCKFDTNFLHIPSEALISSITKHQKCFPLFDKDDNLLPLFITISNIQSKQPTQVILGNEKVIRSRLADARFFYESDCENTQIQRREDLKNIVFQTQLGSVFDKTERISLVAQWVAIQIGGNSKEAAYAGKICKSDLVSQMVIEFPDLQGVMGQYYCQNDGDNEQICISQLEQYLPRHAQDNLPKTPTGAAISLADKIDTITGIFSLGLIPTGNKDPFALRRASIGILRIIIENDFSLDLKDLIEQTIKVYKEIGIALTERNNSHTLPEIIISYCLDRLDNIYQEKGVPHDIIQSVKILRPTSPHDFDHRIKAVEQFMLRPEAGALTAANKRIANFMSKMNSESLPEFDKKLLVELEETTLANALLKAQQHTQTLFQQKQYTKFMLALTSLKDPIDHFFDKVLINTDNKRIKNNRLVLLKQLHHLFVQVADISLLQPR